MTNKPIEGWEEDFNVIFGTDKEFALGDNSVARVKVFIKDLLATQQAELENEMEQVIESHALAKYDEYEQKLASKEEELIEKVKGLRKERLTTRCPICSKLSKVRVIECPSHKEITYGAESAKEIDVDYNSALDEVLKLITNK